MPDAKWSLALNTVCDWLDAGVAAAGTSGCQLPLSTCILRCWGGRWCAGQAAAFRIDSTMRWRILKIIRLLRVGRTSKPRLFSQTVRIHEAENQGAIDKDFEVDTITLLCIMGHSPRSSYPALL